MLSAISWSPALGHLEAATSSNNSCLGPPWGRAELGQLLCYIWCIFRDKYSKKITHTISVPKI